MIICERCSKRRAKYFLEQDQAVCLRCYNGEDIQRIYLLDNEDIRNADENPEAPRYNPERPDPPTPEEW